MAANIITPAGDQPMAIGAYVNSVNGFTAAIRRHLLIAQADRATRGIGGRQIPYASGSIKTTGDQPTLIRTDGQRRDVRLVATKDSGMGGGVLGRQVPEASSSVDSTSDQPVAVGAEDDSIESIG